MKNSKIKVLVATKETQGMRDDDFCFIPAGEFVKYGICERSLVGFSSGSSTTTFRVVSVDLSRDEYINAYIASNKTAGWDVTNVNTHKRMALDLLGAAQEFPVGSVLELRDGCFIVRKAGLKVKAAA